MSSSPFLVFACALIAGIPVASNAAVFPKPSPEKAFAEMKIFDDAGHPWRVAHEDWDAARQRVVNEPEWAKWTKQQRSSVDAWIAKHPTDRVEWVCGWWHDFVSPKDGSHLTWTDEVPGEDVKFLHSPSDPHVEITPKLMGGWVFEFRSEQASKIRAAARLYRLTGEKRYAEWAAAQLDFYAQHYLEWPLSVRNCRLYWQTLDEATNCAVYVETVRLLGDYATADRRATWQHRFFEPTVALLNKTMQSIHNIATWQRCAVAQVALEFRDEAMFRDALDSKFGLRRQMAEGVTSDYLWCEQSIGYNDYVVRAVNTLFTAAGLYGRAAELSDEMSIAENLMLSTAYLSYPDGHTPNPADVTSKPEALDRKLYALVYRIFPTAIGVQEAAGLRTWDTLVDPPAGVKGTMSPARAWSVAAKEQPKIVSQNLESSRMAMLKSGRWQVFFHYGQLTASHSQAEALNFSAFYGDTDVTHDPGTVGYGSPLHKGYYTRGLNHNVPLVNGEGEVPPQLGELLAYSAAPASVSAAQPHYQKKATARRSLVIEGEKLIDTATVESTERDAPQKLGLSLHLQGKARLPSTFQPDASFAAGRPESFNYWREVTAASFHDRAVFDVEYGNVVMRVSIATPGDFRVWHARTPDFPPGKRDGFYVETVGQSATFTTTFEPVK